MDGGSGAACKCMVGSDRSAGYRRPKQAKVAYAHSQHTCARALSHNEALCPDPLYVCSSLSCI
eukprot:1148986-Pelagomonas_calceolata.AAC.6